jgi:nitroimidazol reductase NimA-like FMN-containing flavoprotein (pyridoxamine 5'-phosphate oxidase superfamily)
MRWKDVDQRPCCRISTGRMPCREPVSPKADQGLYGCYVRCCQLRGSTGRHCEMLEPGREITFAVQRQAANVLIALPGKYNTDWRDVRRSCSPVT